MGHISSHTSSLARILTALILFCISFGFVEAAVVVYLRATYEPLHQQLYPDRSPTDLFPILRPEQLADAGPVYTQRLYTELAREAATILMLAAVALAVAQNARQWLAAFVIAFGVWDIFFYISLRVLVGWPASLFDWDLLFLLPLPWVGPVLAPVIVALSMIVAGAAVLWCEARGQPMALTRRHWAAIFSGGAIIVIAFCWDWRNIMAGGLPNSFNWSLFALGEVLGVIAFARAASIPFLASIPRARLLP